MKAAQAAQLAQTMVKVRKLTKLQFMETLTTAELAGIYTAAKTEVMVEVFMDKLKLAEFIDLDDPATIAGLQALSAAGLITAARVTEILGQ